MLGLIETACTVAADAYAQYARSATVSLRLLHRVQNASAHTLKIATGAD